MDIFLPKGFEPGRARRPLRRLSHNGNLSVEAAGVFHPVLRRWASGFAMAMDDVPALRGVVTLYDGAEMLHQCLITGRKAGEGEVVFTVKTSSQFDYAVTNEIDPSVHNNA